MAFIIFEVCFLYAHFIDSFYHNLVVNFAQFFFHIYWDDHVIFIFQFVNVVYHIGWFSDVKSSLHPRDKCQLIILNLKSSFKHIEFGLLIFCWEILHPSVLLAWNFLFLWCLCLALLSEWCWPQNDFGSILSFSSFWYNLRRVGVKSSLSDW